jgi:hypothetical protein
MNGRDERKALMEALSRTLDAYGSDAARWPKGSADRLRTLIAEAPEARALLTEARALERVLDRAPVPSTDRVHALADRIVAAAVAEQAVSVRPATGGGRVIALPARIRDIRRAAAAADRTVWQTAALLAACLVAGIYIGSSPLVTPVLQDVAQSIGVVEEGDGMSYAFFDESLEEDTL